MVSGLPRLSWAKVEHRPRRLRAGHQPCGAISFCQQPGRFGDAARARVVECSRLHASAARFAELWMADKIRSGVRGKSLTSTFSGRNASLTAETMAA